MSEPTEVPTPTPAAPRVDADMASLREEAEWALAQIIPYDPGDPPDSIPWSEALELGERIAQLSRLLDFADEAPKVAADTICIPAAQRDAAVEETAKALYAVYSVSEAWEWADEGESVKERWRDDARAILAALTRLAPEVQK